MPDQVRRLGQTQDGSLESAIARSDHGHHRFPTAHPLRRKNRQTSDLPEALILGALSLVASSLIEWMV